MIHFTSCVVILVIIISCFVSIKEPLKLNSDLDSIESPRLSFRWTNRVMNLLLWYLVANVATLEWWLAETRARPRGSIL